MKEIITYEFVITCDEDRDILSMFREASEIHAKVNQRYGENDAYPYSKHIGDVLFAALEFSKGFPVFDNNRKIIAFGACFHDTIEDARLTYNDVLDIARTFFTNSLDAKAATEIVYALTNEKGRNRAERANEKYYEGIRNTPFAPFIKFCDRYANYIYAKAMGTSMAKKYRQEMPEFVAHIIDPKNEDSRFMVPQTLIDELTL